MGVEHVAVLHALSPSIPIIVVTAEDRESLLRSLADCSVFAIMRSPVVPQDLLHMVARARGGRETL
jgi:DNA-binding NarL/FixJ family response regulator